MHWQLPRFLVSRYSAVYHHSRKQRRRTHKNASRSTNLTFRRQSYFWEIYSHSLVLEEIRLLSVVTNFTYKLSICSIILAHPIETILCSNLDISQYSDDGLYGWPQYKHWHHFWQITSVRPGGGMRWCGNTGWTPAGAAFWPDNNLMVMYNVILTKIALTILFQPKIH